MDYDNYIRETSALGFVQKGKDAYGECSGYPVHLIFPGKVNSKVVTAHISLERSPAGKFIKAFNKACAKQATVSLNTRMPDTLLLSFKTPDELTRPFQEAMAKIAELGPEYGVVPPSVCPYCRYPNCDGLMLYKGAYKPVHRQCMERVRQTVGSQAQQNLREGSYLSGICGGLAGGIVATIPNILTIWFLERIFAVLMWLIPLGVSFGYDKCNGKRSRAAGPMLILVSVFCMFLMESMFWAFSYAGRGMALGAAVLQTLPFLLDPAFYVETMTSGNGLMELMFLALGIAMAWSSITRTASSNVADMQACVDTYQDRKS